MTAVVDFNSLVQAVQDFLNRADLIQEIPGFISLAEDKLNTTLKSRFQVSADVSIPVAAGSRVASIPDDMIEPYYMQVGNNLPMFQTNMERIANLRMFRLRNPGTPQYFAVGGAFFEIVPVPSAATTLALTYRARLPPLSANNTTNWLILKHPNIYLQATLEIAAQFLKDNDAVELVSGKMGEAVAALDSTNERATYSSDKSADFLLDSPSDGRTGPSGS